MEGHLRTLGVDPECMLCKNGGPLLLTQGFIVIYGGFIVIYGGFIEFVQDFRLGFANFGDFLSLGPF